jgi:hypothetical protein
MIALILKATNIEIYSGRLGIIQLLYQDSLCFVKYRKPFHQFQNICYHVIMNECPKLTVSPLFQACFHVCY